MKRAAAVIPILLLLCASPALGTGTDAATDCLGEDVERRIKGCSELIETPGLPSKQLSLAHGLRALAYSLKGQYERALPDYDKAIDLDPEYGVALNNRAWAYYKLGRLAEGSDDVAEALRLAPTSPYVLDTRAHIRQAEGDGEAALQDYERAMRAGGRPIVRLYQCGLRSEGLYSGPLDGNYSSAVRGALQTCVATIACDPLPEDEDCTPNVS